MKIQERVDIFTECVDSNDYTLLHEGFLGDLLKAVGKDVLGKIAAYAAATVVTAAVIKMIEAAGGVVLSDEQEEEIGELTAKFLRDHLKKTLSKKPTDVEVDAKQRGGSVNMVWELKSKPIKKEIMDIVKSVADPEAAQNIKDKRLEVVVSSAVKDALNKSAGDLKKVVFKQWAKEINSEMHGKAEKAANKRIPMKKLKQRATKGSLDISMSKDGWELEFSRGYRY